MSCFHIQRIQKLIKKYKVYHLSKTILVAITTKKLTVKLNSLVKEYVKHKYQTFV